ncbi:ABC transporter ATP-binding protein [Planctomycetota bacterium]|nr:ABC transporter ATP-binding protein [Planctomycetota bacterium]
MDVALETKGLSKTYGKFRKIVALKPLDITIKSGAAFGLLGANGAGKSTFVKTLLGVCKATTGRATVFGEDFRSPNVRKKIGYLPEGTHFPRYMTGRQVCEYFGNLAGLKRAELKKEVDEKLELVEMQEWADRKVSKYSKGMRQRIGLAQAMIGNPSILILDEPTDGVDPPGRRAIRQVIKKLRDEGATIIWNSHLLAEVEDVCDEIAILYRGELLKRGTIRDIIEETSVDKDGRYRVRFRTGELPEQMPDELSGRTATYDGFELKVSELEDVNTLIDVIRGAGIHIFGVERPHVSLEEAFIQIMDDGDHHGVGGSK